MNYVLEDREKRGRGHDDDPSSLYTKLSRELGGEVTQRAYSGL